VPRSAAVRSSSRWSIARRFKRAIDRASNIDQFFGEVVTSEQIMACWPSAEVRLRAAS
jgi:hypothetical protein